jgi:hypothetical protein
VKRNSLPLPRIEPGSLAHDEATDTPLLVADLQRITGSLRHCLSLGVAADLQRITGGFDPWLATRHENSCLDSMQLPRLNNGY